MAECDLPKVETRVRFPSGAPYVRKPHNSAVFIFRYLDNPMIACGILSDLQLIMLFSPFIDRSGVSDEYRILV